MKIAVSSQNPTKVAAVHAAATELFNGDYELEAYKINSGVEDQPLGLDETNLGAVNRARGVLATASSADIGIGMEGGLVIVGGRFINMGVVYVLGRNGLSGIGISQGHAIPDHLVSSIMQGKELSVAVAEHYGTDTINDRDCSIVITQGRLSAVEHYRQPTVLALLDFQSKT